MAICWSVPPDMNRRKDEFLAMLSHEHHRASHASHARHVLHQLYVFVHELLALGRIARVVQLLHLRLYLAHLLLHLCHVGRGCRLRRRTARRGLGLLRERSGGRDEGPKA
jgi:hypothetical protein